MAQFLGTVVGQRGKVSRLGSKESGMDARVNGWLRGIWVEARVEDGVDVFRVYSTGGSSGNAKNELVYSTEGETP